MTRGEHECKWGVTLGGWGGGGAGAPGARRPRARARRRQRRRRTRGPSAARGSRRPCVLLVVGKVVERVGFPGVGGGAQRGGGRRGSARRRPRKAGEELALRPGPAGGVVPLLVAEFPLDDAPAAWAAWAAALPTLPPGVYPNFALARGASGAPAALALALDLALDAAGRAAGRAAFAALGAALAAAGGAVTPPADLPVLEVLALHDAGGDFYPAHATYNYSAFTDALGDADAAAAFFAAVLGAFRVATSPRAMLVFSPTGPRGARARAPGAFGDRAGLLWFEVLGSWERTAGGPAADGDAAHVAWALAARRAAAPWARVEYLNNSMLGHAAGGVTPRDCFWPADAERIAAAKARYDPAGVLLAFD